MKTDWRLLTCFIFTSFLVNEIKAQGTCTNPSTITTTGGNADGKVCCNGWTLDGQAQSPTCISTPNDPQKPDGPWCATTDVYNGAGGANEWGYCPSDTTAAPVTTAGPTTAAPTAGPGTTVAPGTTNAAACTPYTFLAGVQSRQYFNGASNAATTLAACQAACIALAEADPTSCLRIGFEGDQAGTGSCWINDASDVVSTDTGSATYYTYDRTDNTACGTTSLPQTSACDAGRSYRYQMYADQYGDPAGTNAGTVADANECKDKCDALGSGCVGIDFDTRTTTCFTYSAEPTLVADTSGNYDHYKRFDCEGSGCTVDTFLMTADKNAQGGVQESGVTSQPDCDAACLAKTIDLCAAYDFNTVDSSCWLFTTNPATLNDATGINHYTREPCDPTGTATPTGCVSSFDLVANNQLSFGAEESTASNTLALCEAACTSDSTCVGFDFDTNNNQCWIHQDLTKFEGDVNSNAPGVDQYKKVDCVTGTGTGGVTPTGQCVFTYVKNEDTLALGGNRVSGVDNVADCQSACENNVAGPCPSFDFSNTDSACFQHTDPVEPQAANGVDHYVRTESCGAAGCPVGDAAFDKYDNTNANGATQAASSYDTAEECRDFCLSQTETECAGFDFNRAESQCWIHSDADQLTEDLRNANPNIDLYVRIPCDSSVSPTGTGIVTGVTGTGTGAGGVCYTSEETQYFGAAEAAAQNTVALCQAECDGNADCVAYGFDSSGNRCWIHTNADQVSSTANSSPGTDYTSYIKGDCGTACPAYEELLDTQYFGADLNSANTQADCEAACDADTSCVGFGLDTNSDPDACWIHTVATEIEGDGQTFTGYNTYKKGSGANCVSGTATGAVSGSACPEAYTSNEDTQYFGAAGNAANTVADCQAACDGDSTCLAFGFDTNAADGSKCWIHTNSADLDGTPSSTSGFDTYVKNADCVLSPSPSPQGCADAYTLEEDKQYFGATKDTTAETLEACQTACTDNAECVGFGFNANPSPNECWIHVSTDDFGNSAVFTNYDSYMKNTECPSVIPTGTGGVCVPTYTEHENSYSLGGAGPLPDVTTVDECKTWCTDNEACGAFDFSGNQCWWHNNGDWENQLQTNGNNVVQYRKSTDCVTGTGGTGVTPTGGVCVDSFQESPNSYAIGATRDPDASDVAACTTVCLADSDCVGFDFNTRDSACWIHTNAEAFNNLQTDNDGVTTNYQREPCVPGTGQECIDTFTSIDNTNANGGQKINGRETADDCKAYCLTQTDCVGFDFDTNVNECWVHLDAANLDNTGTASGVVHYVRQAATNCVTGGSAVPTGDDCVDNFIEQEDTLAFGGIFLSTADTQAKCEEVCLSVDECVGFDFDTNNNACYWFDDPSKLEASNKKTGSTGINHFEREKCLPSVQPCVDTFEEFENTHAYNGEFVATADDVDACKANCLSNSNCLGFDFNGGCYVHNDAANFENVNTNANDVSHFRRTNNDACGASPSPSPGTQCILQNTYEAVQENAIDTRFNAASSQTSQPRSILQCQSECNAMSGCAAFNYLQASQTCIFYMGFGTTTYSFGFDYYVRQCQGAVAPCIPSTRIFPRQSSSGGVQIAAVNDYGTCLKTCFDDVNCAGIDYAEQGTLNQRCYTHTATSLLNVVSRADVSQTRITSRECAGPGPAPTPAPGGCLMTVQENRLQNGGEVVLSGILPRVMTQQQCTDACLTDPYCKAADYNKDVQICFKHYVDGPIIDQGATCCNRLVKSSCPSCFETFIWRANQVLNIPGNNGNIVAAGASGQTRCARLCFENAQCDAFEYITSSGGQCIHFNNVLNPLNPPVQSQNNVGLFLRNRCDAPPPTQGPVVPTLPPTQAPPSDGCIRNGYVSPPVQRERLTAVDPTLARNFPGIQTSAQCVQACTTYAPCRALTFDPSGICTIFTTRQVYSFIDQSPAAAGVISYRVQCLGDATQSPVVPTQPPIVATPPPPPTAAPTACAVASTISRDSEYTGIDSNIVMTEIQADQFQSVVRASGANLATSIRLDSCIGDNMYFVCMATGLKASNGVRIELDGAYDFELVNGGSVSRQTFPVSLVRDSSSHAGIDVMDRCLIIRPSQLGTTLSLQLRQGNSYSDPVGYETGLSVFSLSDWIASRDTAFMVARRTTFTCATPCDLSFQTSPSNNAQGNPYLVQSGSSIYNRINDRFTCQSNGVYFFSFSIGLNAGNAASVSLEKVSLNQVTERYTLDRLNTAFNGIDMISKVVMLNCQRNDVINLKLNSGSAVSNENLLTSFSGFALRPRSGLFVAWAAYLTTDVDVTSPPNGLSAARITYDRVEVNEGNAYNAMTGAFVAPRAGTYFVYVSTGVQSNRFVNLFVRKSFRQTPEFAVVRLHTVHTNTDNLGRGAIVQLQQNEELYVEGMVSSALRAGENAASFMGMLLYES